MRENGMDPNMISGFSGDPSTMITLYKLDLDQGARKIYLMKSGGGFSFGKNKNTGSEKYTFSLKKIRSGYWELVIDKALPKGEYGFSMMGMGQQPGVEGFATVFTFGID